MMQEKEPVIKSLDKFATLKGLPNLLNKLCKVRENVVNGSGVGAKLFRKRIPRHSRHKRSRLAKDMWYKECTLKKKWSKIIKKEGNEALAKNIPGEKLARHWWWSARRCESSAVRMKKIWMEGAEHWNETKELSKKHYKLLQDFMESQNKSIPHYLTCRSTSKVESSHRLSNKYISKQFCVGFLSYHFQKSMLLLNYNENANKKEKKRLKRGQT